MNRRSWICFDCRKGVRRETDYSLDRIEPTKVTCPDCGEACLDVGYKLRIPGRRDARAWTALRESLRNQAAEIHEDSHRADARNRHRIERRIQMLRERPEDPERTKLIQELEDELGDEERAR